ncbi:hypothetical protein UFOVP149_39 [uncultured Caudovirales phage]|uniref:Gene product 88 domain-containing protein n=1 Tax=uncultured Caudovirales phage TaxID=2100421 RepID=A0A6J7W6T3_9CAUD|nr:hypothetical protein UFOVP149_39 [uncultured Caudovirales phage]
MFKGKLIISGNNAKTVKGDGTEYETAIMYLAPFTQAGRGNVCAMAVMAHCWEGCLNTAGRGAMNSVQRARVAKTRRYMEDRASFMAQLIDDLRKFANYAKRKGVQPCVRLNGTSDIMWEKGHPVTVGGVRFASVMEAFPMIQFYDYSKIYTRVDKTLPANYAITLSYSEANPDFASEIINRVMAGKANMAVVYRTKELAQQAVYEHGAIDGDLTDMRFLDLQPMDGGVGNTVALYAKGRAKRDTSGFVIGEWGYRARVWVKQDRAD